MYRGENNRTRSPLLGSRIGSRLEDRILCPRTMATYAFFAITFFLAYFFKVSQHKEEKLKAKIIRKIDRSPYSFRRKQFLSYFPPPPPSPGNSSFGFRRSVIAHKFRCFLDLLFYSSMSTSVW